MIDTELYIHFPFCEKRCKYCDFFSTVGQQDLMEKYAEEVCTEIARLSARFSDARIVTVYLGGGTPSLVPVPLLAKILDTVHRYFEVQSKETTIEVNPNSSDNLSEYPSLGIDRVSIGVQSMQDFVLKKLGRVHTADEALSALRRAAAAFSNISGDLIIGVDEEQNIEEEVKILSDYCTHISGYMLEVIRGTPLQKEAHRKIITLPDDEKTVEQYELLTDTCRTYGLFRYETSNFAKLGMEGKHNSGYWAMTPYLGVGPSAHSYYRGKRFYNRDNLDEYLSGVHAGYGKELSEREYSKRDEMEETVMLALRTANGLDVDAFNKKFNTDFLREKKAVIAALDGKVKLLNHRLYIPSRYFAVQNAIIAELLS